MEKSGMEQVSASEIAIPQKAESKVAKKKVYQCMFVLYPETQSELIAYVQANFSCAWALHDKDLWEEDGEGHKKGDLKKPHVHFVCKFRSARYLSGIAKELKLPEGAINYCHNLYAAYAYLWHGNSTDKYQYDPSIVGMHDFTPPTDGAGMGLDEQAQVAVMLDMPFAQFGSTVEMARWAYDNGCWSSFKSSYAIWRDIRAEIRSRRNLATCYGTNAVHPDNPMPGYQPISGDFPAE